MAKNHVIDYQRFYQRAHATPLWLRHPRSKIIVYPYYALAFVTCGAVPLYYLGRAIMGKKERA